MHKNMQSFITMTLFAIILFTANHTLPAQTTVIPKAKYLEFARSSADWAWRHKDSLVSRWRSTFDSKSIFGYRPPQRLLDMAAVYAILFDVDAERANMDIKGNKDKKGNIEFAARAKMILLTIGDYRKEYPKEAADQRPDYEDGIPPLTDFFTTMMYIRAFEILNRHGFLDNSEKKTATAIIVESLDYTMRSQEWGAMNRSALRAETLAWAVRALPGHRKAKTWKVYEQALGSDNWGNWEIEDATLYHAVWLNSMLGYADANKRTGELFHTPEMYYYAQYFLNLMCPAGIIPDFGDSHWMSGWSRFLVFFEAAANQYQDPELKWAASTIGNLFIDFDNVTQTWLAYLLMDCYRYADDDLIPKQPVSLSREVMEDVQGKKVVFRSGWDSLSTYMLLNYRDEGDGGLLFRDYLRDGIPVEEEKMTHGHADENSIPLLMYKGSVLLHDGGYRDMMPSGIYGAYRQDYFHNRLCVRDGKIWMGQKKGEYRYSPSDHPEIPGQSVLDFLRNAGSYRRIRTQKIDFLSFDDFDYSRTRLIDDKMGYEWDRVVTYIKDPEMFVVFDILKATDVGYLTASNLWHTRRILSRGEHWYDTGYDSLNIHATSTDNNLFIYFPKTHYRIEQAEQAGRYYQQEYAISQTTAQHFELGQYISFATILIPHPASADPSGWPDKISMVESKPAGKGISLKINHNGKEISVGVKCDMRMDIIRDYRRPKYTYESGRLEFGKLETNGDFFYTERAGDILNFTIVNLSKAFYGGITLFEQQAGFYGLSFDGSSDQSGIGKARYWRGEVRLE